MEKVVTKYITDCLLRLRVAAKVWAAEERNQSVKVKFSITEVVSRIYMCTLIICALAWFYHVPPKNESKDRVGYPLLSQIPGLGHTGPSSADPESKQGWIRESDSAYVKLAKQGGRPDLLNMQPRVASKIPSISSTYKRCDWYYHDSTANQLHGKGSKTGWESRNSSSCNISCSVFYADHHR